MIEFIKFDSFIVKKNEIIYAEKVDKLSIKLTTNTNNQNKNFTMNFNCEWVRDDCFTKLTIDVDAWEAGHAWKHPLVNAIRQTRDSVRTIEDEFASFRKEIANLRKELKRQRTLKEQ